MSCMRKGQKPAIGETNRLKGTKRMMGRASERKELSALSLFLCLQILVHDSSVVGSAQHFFWSCVILARVCMDFSSDKQHDLILPCHREIDGKDQNLQFAKVMNFLSTSPSIFSGLSWANRREDPPFNRKALSLMRGKGAREGGRRA